MTNDQPMPTSGGVKVTPVARGAFLEMLAEREARGIETYGTSLTTDNGRDVFRDLMEELIDGWQYTVQALLEDRALKAEIVRLRARVIALGGQP